MNVRHGHLTDEVVISGLGNGRSYVITLAQARDLARQLLTVAGTPDRIVAGGEAAKRIERLEKLVLDGGAAVGWLGKLMRPEHWEAIHALEAEAELIRAEQAGAEVIGG